MGVLTRKKKKRDNLPSPRKNIFLKIVHPHGYVEVFREPILAGEIMRRYPRYCIARPDVFEFPWIVVRPESVLVPGNVFYLVPYATLDRLLKAKTGQLESFNQSSENRHYQRKKQSSPIDLVNPSHEQKDIYYWRRSQYHRPESSCEDTPELQDSDSDSNYKESFYKTWNKIGRNLDIVSHQESFSHLDLGLDSPLHTTSVTRGASDPSLVPPNPRLISCMRKPDSDRKRLNLRVHFIDSVVITRSERGAPSRQQVSFIGYNFLLM